MALRLCFHIWVSTVFEESIKQPQISKADKIKRLTHILKNHKKSICGSLYHMRVGSVAGNGALGIKNSFHCFGAGQNDDSHIQNFDLLEKKTW